MEENRNPDASNIRCVLVSVRVLAFANLVETRILFISSPDYGLAMTVRKLDFYYKTAGMAPEHRQLFAYAETIGAMQRVLMKMLPPSLAQYCALSGFSGGNLTICADNGATATKLRQMLPSLLLEFQATGYEVTAIRIAVQANYRNTQGRKFFRKNRSIGSAGIENLNTLASGLPESPLKTAIQSLAKKTADASGRKKE